MKRPHVGALDHDYLRMRAQPFVQLPITDVDGGDARSTTLQQDVRESTGGSTDIKTVTTGGIDAENVERVCELVPAARHVRRRSLDLERRGLVDLHAGLVMSRHSSRKHECLRLRA